MKLTINQRLSLRHAIDKLEAADMIQQSALGDYVESSDLHYKIDGVIDEILGLLEAANTGDE